MYKSEIKIKINLLCLISTISNISFNKVCLIIFSLAVNSDKEGV